MQVTGDRQYETTPVVVARYRVARPDGSEAFPHFPVNEHLALTLGLVEGETTRIVSEAALDELGIAFGVTLGNGLRRIFENAPEPRWIVPGLALFSGPGASGRIIYPTTIWTDFGPERIVASVPVADRLYVTTEGNTRALARLADELQALSEETGEVESLRTFRLDNDVWWPWMPTAKPLRRRFELLAAEDDAIRDRMRPPSGPATAGIPTDSGRDARGFGRPLDGADPRPEAQPDSAVYPVVIARVRAEHFHRLGGDTGGSRHAFEILSEHLAVGLELQTGSSRSLMRENTTGTPAFDLRECLSNEIERMKRLPIEPEWVRPGLACLTGPNASAWMLCPEKLSSLTGSDGAPVVGVPFTNEIYVAGERNSGAIKHLAQTLVAFANTNTDVESTRLFRFDGSDWIEWKPVEARLRKTCKELEVADLKIQANRQAGLQQVYGDVIPASVHAATVKTIATIKGEFATMAVWAPEPVALPRVDAVAFLRDNGVIVVRWKDVKRRFGDMLVPLGTYPQRFLTTGYPTRKQLDSLASHVRKSESPPNFG